MKLRSLGIVLALAAVLHLGIACGGGDNANSNASPTNGPSSSVADPALYFQQLGGILSGVNDQTSQLNSQYPAAGADPDQTRQYLSQYLPVFTTGLNSIKILNPPSTTKDLHDKFVSALEDLLAANTTLSDDVQSLNTVADVKAYFDGHKTDFAAKTNLVHSSCSALQTQANNMNLGVDLKCTRTSRPAATPAPGGAPPAATAASP
jgi:hypothetical protein